MYESIKISINNMDDYVTDLANSRMKHMNDFLELIDSKQKDDTFYSNAVHSIKTVIEHFDIVEDAFEDLSKETLTAWGDNNYHLRFYIDYMFEKADRIPKYIHYFDVYDFKTNYIINPLARTLKNYKTKSDCTVCLSKEGLLLNVKFFEKIHSHDNKKIEMTYNNLFELAAITRSYDNHLTGKSSVKAKAYCENIEEEIYFIHLFLSDGYTSLLEDIPELTIPSAYNFGSDEFNIRLKVAEMILI